MISNKTKIFLAALMSITCVQCSISLENTVAFGDDTMVSKSNETHLESTCNEQVSKYVYGNVSEDEEIENYDSVMEYGEASPINTTSSDSYEIKTININNVSEEISESDLQAAITKYSSMVGQQLDKYNVKFILRDVNSYIANHDGLSLDADTEKQLAISALQTLSFYFDSINSGSALLDYYYSIGLNSNVCNNNEPNIHVNNVKYVNFDIANTLNLSDSKYPTESDFNDVCAAILARNNDDEINKGKVSNPEEVLRIDLDSLPGYKDVCRTCPGDYDYSILKINLGIAEVSDYRFIGLTDTRINEYSLPTLQKAMVKAQKEKYAKVGDVTDGSARLTWDEINHIAIDITNKFSDSFNACNANSVDMNILDYIGASWIGCLDLKQVSPALTSHTKADIATMSDFINLEAYALSSVLSDSNKVSVNGQELNLETLKTLDQAYFNAIGKKITEIKNSEDNKNELYISNEEAAQAILAGINEVNESYSNLNSGNATAADYENLNLNLGKYFDYSNFNSFVKNNLTSTSPLKTVNDIKYIQNIIDNTIEKLKQVNENTVEANLHVTTGQNKDLVKYPTTEKSEYNNSYTDLGLNNIDSYTMKILQDEVTKARAKKRHSILESRTQDINYSNSPSELIINNYLSLDEIKKLYNDTLTKINASFANIKNGTASLQDYINAKIDFMPALNVIDINEGIKGSSHISDTTFTNLPELNAAFAISNYSNNTFSSNVKHKEDYEELQSAIFRLAYDGEDSSINRFNEYTNKIITTEISNSRKNTNHALDTKKELRNVIDTALDNLNKCYEAINEGKAENSHFAYAQFPWIYWANVLDANQILKGQIETCTKHDPKTLTDYYDVIELYKEKICSLSLILGGSDFTGFFKAIGVDNVNSYTATIVRDYILEVKKTDPLYKEQNDVYHIDDIKALSKNALSKLVNCYYRMNKGEATVADFTYSKIGWCFTEFDSNMATKNNANLGNNTSEVESSDDSLAVYITPEFYKDVQDKVFYMTTVVQCVNERNALYAHYNHINLNTDPYILDLTKEKISNEFSDSESYKSSGILRAMQNEVIYDTNISYNAVLNGSASKADFEALKLKHIDNLSDNKLAELNSNIANHNNTLDSTEIAELKNTLSAKTTTAPGERRDDTPAVTTEEADFVTTENIATLQYIIDSYLNNETELSEAEKEMISYETSYAANPDIFYNLNNYNITIINSKNDELADIDTINSILADLDKLYITINMGQATREDYKNISADDNFKAKIDTLTDEQLLNLNKEVTGKFIINPNKTQVIYKDYKCNDTTQQSIIRTSEDYKIITDALNTTLD